MEEKLRRKFTSATDMEIQAASRMMERINGMDFARALLPLIVEPGLRASVLDAMDGLVDRMIDTMVEQEVHHEVHPAPCGASEAHEGEEVEVTCARK